MADFIRDYAGNIPELSSNTDDWSGWFALNSDISFLPKNADFFMNYDMDSRVPAKEPVTESGRYIDLDWACDADWYRPKFHWRGWIPIADPTGTLPCPPFLDFSKPAPTFRRNDSTFGVETTFAYEIARQCASLDALTKLFSVYEIWDEETTVAPPVCDDPFKIGSVSYATEEDLQRAVANCRRAIADRMGWLEWFANSIPQAVLKDKIQDDVLKELLDVTSTRYARRGYLLQLSEDWTEANIPLWLSHSIPIYYSWYFDESEMPNLVRMNPRLIASNTSNERISLHYVEEDDALKVMISDSHLYDDFFQPRTPEETQYHLSFELDAKFYIIDFQGWRRRALPSDADHLVYRSRYYFRTDSEEDGSTAVTFWRWRKKPQTIMARLSPQLSLTGDFDESFIREMGKYRYAPKGRFQYDYETGLRLDGKSSGPSSDQGALSLFDDKAASSDDQNSEGIVEEAEREQEPPRSLLERLNFTENENVNRLRPFESIANITSWRNAAREDEDQRRSDSNQQSWVVISRREEEFAARQRDPHHRNRRRSASPPRYTAVRTVLPREQPLALFRNNLRKIAHCITYHQRLYPITMYLDWNPILLEKGVLVLPDPRAEVRMRYFANCINRDVRHVSTLLSLAIEHRFSFRIAIKKEDIRFFAPRRVSQAVRVLGASLYDSNYREANLTFTTATSFFATYIGQIADLLNRPNGPAFIGLGGPCSWLAHRWGGDEILKRFMTGPSIQTTIFEKGASDIKLSNPQGLVWDDVSGQDIELLFGYVPHNADRRHDRWLYPPPHIIEQYCDNWSGEWNGVMETIFCFITDKLMATPCAWEPKSKGSWKTWLRTYNRGRYQPVHTLTQEYVDDIIKGFRLVRLPPSWNQRPLSSIHIPESSDD